MCRRKDRGSVDPPGSGASEANVVLRLGTLRGGLMALVVATRALGFEPARPAAPHPKPTAPIELQLAVLRGGGAGERTTVLFLAEPAGQGGRLDLDLAVPEGMPVVGGSSAESVTPDGAPRILTVEVEVPATGVFRLVGKARWTLGEGAVFAKAAVLDLPLGSVQKPDPLPLRALPTGGYRVEFDGRPRP